ncbi:MAG TPA: hypothetical protein VFC78_06195 [Tepidisphaeraceae bacterium]|nr:hypothetical protein [Tepidisphaeraceae bacterium]
MNESEKEELVHAALAIVGERCSFDPHYMQLTAENAKAELENEDLDDRLMRAWPADWPSQQVVHLDNVGDPGAWIPEALGEPVAQVLFGWAWDDEANAANLAEEYCRRVTELGGSLPSDFDEDTDSEDLVQADFVGFLKEWRNRVLATIEKQNTYSAEVA